MKKKVITVEISTDLHTRLFTMARRVEQPAAQFVRDAIRERISRLLAAEATEQAVLTKLETTDAA